jgi:hypothetical protein
MSSRDRLLLALVVPAVLIAAFWFLLLSPKRAEIKRLNSDVDAARASLADSAAKLARNRSDRDQVQANLRTLAGAGRAVPAEVAVPPLLRQLQRTAGSSRVKMQIVSQTADTSATSTPPGGTPATAGTTPGQVSGGGIHTTEVSLSFEGRYGEVQGFFGRLQRLVRLSGQRIDATGRLVSVSSVELSPGSKGFPTLTATVNASIYSLADLSELLAQATGSSPGAAPQTAAAGSTAPVTAAAATPAVTP